MLQVDLEAYDGDRCAAERRIASISIVSP